MRAVARAAGVSASTVMAHLDRHGNLDRLGCGRISNWDPRATMRRITFGARSWDSLTAFAAEMQVHRSTAWAWLKSGEVERIMARVIQADARKAKAVAA